MFFVIIKAFLAGAGVSGIACYFIGSNNPYPAAKKRILAKAQASLDKLKKA